MKLLSRYDLTDALHLNYWLSLRVKHLAAWYLSEDRIWRPVYLRTNRATDLPYGYGVHRGAT